VFLDKIFDGGDRSRQLPNLDGRPMSGDCDKEEEVSSLLDVSSSSCRKNGGVVRIIRFSMLLENGRSIWTTMK
jgi:hypothetical protein